ncbi:FmdB family zinc ribbon protein [Neomoorella thermoacetica]|uniref:FmdB family zinc ribbon protein n=1 Tax=Neomoorella thermoacetica TaxID=1525 RepID=UPI0008FB78CD|nr:zinc ribbon domain-containing protein [Moorella thermoacetica]OIQ60269.1 zinc ribbon domain protein [Moorella thermoacetica]
MPIYEFRCLHCGKLFEKRFTTMDEKVELSCPECQSPSLERVISKVNFIAHGSKSEAKPKLISKSCSPGSNCMALDIPGPDE